MRDLKRSLSEDDKRRLEKKEKRRREEKGGRQEGKAEEPANKNKGLQKVIDRLSYQVHT